MRKLLLKALFPAIRVFLRWGLVKRAFLLCGWALALNRVAGEDDVIRVIRKIRPVSAGRELIRIGDEQDGGYLVPDDLAGVSANFSPGTGAGASFEEDLAGRYSIRSFLADYSVDEAPVQNADFDFEKKFLGAVNNDRYMRLEDWVESKAGARGDEEFMLQMDIEGAEFEVLLDTPSEVLRRFRIMVVEFHEMERMLGKDTLGLVERVFDKILKDFCVVHIHPNNYLSVYKAGKAAVPSIFEVTFYRRDRAVFDGAELSFPHRLDRKNFAYAPELVLPEIWRD